MEQQGNNQKFSLADPFGHYSRKTKIERLWNSFWGAFSIDKTKIVQYSQYAGMSHHVSRYDLTPFSIRTDNPNEDWIIENSKTFVRTEFSDHDNTVNPPLPLGWPPKIDEKTIYLSSLDFDNFLLNSEWINRKINIKESPNETPNEIAKSIYEALCNNSIGSAKNKSNNKEEEFVKKILPTIEKKGRPLFMLPAFPFKDQNRFRIDYNADTPDFSEIAFMLKLSNLTETIYQICSNGSDIIILTDGDLYKDIFGIASQDVTKYLNRLIEYRYSMNIQGAISFISLKEMIDRSSDDSLAWKLKDCIKNKLKRILNTENSEIQNIFNILVSGMKWNLNNRTDNAEYSLNLKDYNDVICWQILKWDKSAIEIKYHDIWQVTHDRAINAALEYASVNLMLRWTELMSKFFPDAIRATIHPKPNQFALSTGGTYAWNGIAFSKRIPKNIDDIQVTNLLNLVNNTPIYQVKFESTDLPCFYTTTLKNINIELAKDILNSQGWELENIHGREFILSDVEDFIQLGENDANFSWERVEQSDTYFTSLLQFRISHYKRHGFGIHGIWIDNKLVGQCGIQILDKDLDQVEVVIFLGKKYVKQGIGRKLLNYIVSQCKEKGLRTIYAVIRPENLAAIKLFEQNGFKKTSSKKHYNYEGIFYTLKLKNN